MLEHPSASKLFGSILPLPGQTDKFGGYTIKINQHDFGHLAQKSSWIYVCGIAKRDLPAQALNFDAITHVVSTTTRSKKRAVKELSKKKRDATPELFAKWLIEVCQLIELNKNSHGQNT